MNIATALHREYVEVVVVIAWPQLGCWHPVVRIMPGNRRRSNAVERTRLVRSLDRSAAKSRPFPSASTSTTAFRISGGTCSSMLRARFGMSPGPFCDHEYYRTIYRDAMRIALAASSKP